MTITGTIRRAIQARVRQGQTMKDIAKAARVDPSLLTRFMQGRDAVGTKLDAIAKVLGLELRPREPRTPKGDR